MMTSHSCPFLSKILYVWVKLDLLCLHFTIFAVQKCFPDCVNISKKSCEFSCVPPEFLALTLTSRSHGGVNPSCVKEVVSFGGVLGLEMCLKPF